MFRTRDLSGREVDCVDLLGEADDVVALAQQLGALKSIENFN